MVGRPGQGEVGLGWAGVGLAFVPPSVPTYRPPLLSPPQQDSYEVMLLLLLLPGPHTDMDCTAHTQIWWARTNAHTRGHVHTHIRGCHRWGHGDVERLNRIKPDNGIVQALLLSDQWSEQKATHLGAGNTHMVRLLNTMDGTVSTICRCTGKLYK